MSEEAPFPSDHHKPITSSRKKKPSTMKQEQRDALCKIFEEKGEELMLTVSGCSSCTGNQAPVMRAALLGKDVYASMPFGNEKEVCYRLVSHVENTENNSNGEDMYTTIVISPFRAILKDEASKARICAYSIDVNNSLDDKARLLKDLACDEMVFHLIFMTPKFALCSEYAADIFDHLYKTSSLTRFVLEDADHISLLASKMGPSKLDLSIFRKKYPEVPILCLTESPSRRCREKVIEQLGLNPAKVEVIEPDLEIRNVSHEVSFTENRLEEMIKRIKDPFEGRIDGKSGIIYCRTRSECEDVAARLRENGITADYYHAQRLDGEQVKTRWEKGTVQVLVATAAFVAGHVWTSLRFIFHYSIPQSIEAYLRNSSRAVSSDFTIIRDIPQTLSVLLYSEADVEKVRWLIHTGTVDPDEDHGYTSVDWASPRNLQMQSEKHTEVQPAHNKSAISFESGRFLQMVRFANEQSKCRSRMLLNYHGLMHCRESCIGNWPPCDNCLNQQGIPPAAHIDVTRYASYALRLIDDCTRLNLPITKQQAIDSLAGHPTEVLQEKKLLSLKSHGLMSKRSRGTVQKLLTALETRYIVGSDPAKETENGEYMHLRVISRSLADAVHEGRIKITLPAFLVFDSSTADDDTLSAMELEIAAADDFFHSTEEDEEAGGDTDDGSKTSSLSMPAYTPDPSFLSVAARETPIQDDADDRLHPYSRKSSACHCKRSSSPLSQQRKKRMKI